MGCDIWRQLAAWSWHLWGPCLLAPRHHYLIETGSWFWGHRTCLNKTGTLIYISCALKSTHLAAKYIDNSAPISAANPSSVPSRQLWITPVCPHISHKSPQCASTSDVDEISGEGGLVFLLKGAQKVVPAQDTIGLTESIGVPCVGH